MTCNVFLKVAVRSFCSSKSKSLPLDIMSSKQIFLPLHVIIIRHISFLYTQVTHRPKSTDSKPPDKSWKLRTNYFNNHHNKEIYGPIRKQHTKNSPARWTEDEEHNVMKQEISIKKCNPKITEKDLNQQLSKHFGNVRTVSSYESRRKTQKWKLAVKNLLNDPKQTFDTNPIQVKQVPANTKQPPSEQKSDNHRKMPSIENDTETFWLNRQQEIINKKRNESLKKEQKQMRPHHTSIATASAQLTDSLNNPHSHSTMEELGTILSCEEKHVNILEHGAKGMTRFL